MIDTNTRLADLTIQEFLDILSSMNGADNDAPIAGVKGLAEYMGCSYATALRLKQSGKVDKAMVQTGRTIRFDRRKLERILKTKGA